MMGGLGFRHKKGRDGGINREKWAGRRNLKTLLWTLILVSSKIYGQHCHHFCVRGLLTYMYPIKKVLMVTVVFVSPSGSQQEVESPEHT